LLFIGWHAIVENTEPGLALDDGYIHLVYAKNLLDGHFFQYNIGESSTGSTGPLWVVLIAIFGLIFEVMNSIWIVSALSYLAAALAAFFLTDEILRSLDLKKPILPMISALLVLIYGRFFWHTFSGMETQLYSAVIAFSLSLFLREVRRRTGFIGSAILAAVALWLRPETFMFFIILSLGWILIERRISKRLLVPLIIISVSCLLYFGYNFVIARDFLPNTFFSKTARYGGSRIDYAQYIFFMFLRENPLILLAVLVFAILGSYQAFHAKKVFLIIPLLWVLGLPAAKFAVSYLEIHYGRYTIPIVPAMMSLGTIAFALIAGNTRWRKLSYLCLLLLIPQLIDFPSWIKTPAMSIWQIHTIHGETSKFIIETTDDDALIATHDVGRIKYDTNRRILDLAGLISKEMTEMMWEKRDVIGHSQITYDSIAAKLIMKHKPELVAVTMTWLPYISANKSALEIIWHSPQLTNAVECVPELAVYRLREGFESAILNFDKHGFRFDKQIIYKRFIPQIKEVQSDLKTMNTPESERYIIFVRQYFESQYPYFDKGLINVITDLLHWDEPDDALEVAILAASLYPDNSAIWNTLGALYSNRRDFEHAREALRKAVLIAPEVLPYRRNFAITLLNCGDTTAAKAQQDTIAKMQDNL